MCLHGSGEKQEKGTVSYGTMGLLAGFIVVVVISVMLARRRARLS